MATTTNWSTQQKIIAGVLIATIIVLVGVLYVVTNQIHNTGTINVIGCNIWANPTLTTPLKSINWGTLNPSDIYAIVCWVQNNGTANVTLSFTTFNWIPSIAQQYLTLSWNYSGQILQPTNVIPIQISLQVSPSIIGVTNFSFDTNITATQI
jgi:hypothetical protein